MDVPSIEELAVPHGSRFVCLLAWDATGFDDDLITGVARTLLEAGCVYACFWGLDCRRVHDLFDRVAWTLPMPGPHDVIMTTWHQRDSLREAVWFALNTAHPTVGFSEGWERVLLITVGSSAWASEVRTLVQTPDFPRQE
jgi:hypothetical protein